MSETKKSVDTVTKTETKKEISQTKTAEDKKPIKKTSKRNLWCIFGGGCCLLLLVLIVLSGLFPFFFAFFRSGADTKTPLPNSSSSSSVRLSPTPTPTAKTTQSQNYPEPEACQPLQLTDSIPIDISPSNPGLKQDIDTHYYQVYGYTPYQVRAQLNECGSKSGDEAYDAYTSYYINWNYNLAPTTNGCSIKNAVVGAKIDYFYPKWEDPGNAEEGLAKRWQTYMTNLIIHEEIHKDISIAGAQAILDALSKISTYPTCDEASSAAATAANNLFEDYKAQNAAYDAETNHGETQGAVFP
ncbi:MAG: DUF922 domain-containing protein [Patescibacteria group bacterium]